MLRWDDPSWLNIIWWATGLLIFVFASHRWALARVQKAFGKKAGPYLVSSASFAKKRWHAILQCLALVCFGLALARPLMGSRLQEVKQTGVEMIIAMDVSNSMLAEDDKPSRLEHAKHEINHLLDQMGGDRVGVIAFAGSAILVSPMTSDHGAIKLYLNSLGPQSVSTQGTNFKDVIDEAIRAFERGGVEGINGTKPTRVLLIASDGEDNEPGGQDAIKKAVDQGIRIFALGFGSARGGPIPLRDERGQLKGYKKDKNGQVVISVPSDEGLGKLAKAGGGAYYHSTFDESEVKNIMADLDRLQKADFKSKMNTEYDERFQIPLMIGLILALIDLLFGDRKPPAELWRGRFGWLSSFLILFILSQGEKARAFGPPSVESNNEAVQQYKAEKYQEAFNGFADALGRDPFNPVYHFNLGDTFYKGGDLPKALAEYEAVESSPKASGDLKFQAMFNAGNVAVEKKDIPKALEYYQKALEYKPDSRETKVNIELALKEQQNQGGGGQNDQEKKQNDKDGKDQDKNNKNEKNDKSDKGDQKKDDNQQQGPQPTPKPTPHGFKSQALNENDVRRILEELKRQEQEIRAKQYKENKNGADRNIEKDW